METYINNYTKIEQSAALSELDNVAWGLTDGMMEVFYKIYQDALSKDKVFLYNDFGFDIEFALVSPKEFKEKGLEIAKNEILAFSCPVAHLADGLGILCGCLIFAIERKPFRHQFLNYQLIRERVMCCTTKPISFQVTVSDEIAWIVSCAFAERESKLRAYIQYLFDTSRDANRVKMHLKILLDAPLEKNSFNSTAGLGYDPFELLKKNCSKVESEFIEYLFSSFRCPDDIKSLLE